MVATSEAKEFLKVLFANIQCWFVSLESQKEFDISLHHFEQKLQSFKQVLGEHTCIVIEKLYTNLLSKKKLLFRHHFMGQSTLGFKGDSIVECSFGVTKNSLIAVDSRRHIDMTGIAIIEQNKEKSERLNMDRSSLIDKSVCWTTCGVKDIITKYALGLFCKNFDRRREYLSVQVDTNKWLVTHLTNISSHKKERSIPRFMRVRKVLLDKDGFMNCSCGRTNEYLLPCVHICKVVDKEEYFGPEQFHVRWHKDYNYYYKTDFGVLSYEKKVSLMDELLKETRSRHYNSDGQYRGCYFKSSSFLKCLIEYSPNENTDDTQPTFIQYLFDKTQVHPVLEGELTMDSLFSNDNIPPLPTTNEGSTQFSIFTEEETVIDIDNSSIEESEEDVDPYHLNYPVFEQALTTIKSSEESEKFRKHLVKFIHENISSHVTSSQDSGSTLINENLLRKSTIQRRHRFAYEKF